MHGFGQETAQILLQGAYAGLQLRQVAFRMLAHHQSVEEPGHGEEIGAGIAEEAAAGGHFRRAVAGIGSPEREGLRRHLHAAEGARVPVGELGHEGRNQDVTRVDVQVPGAFVQGG
jgi:hypothetical protein